MKMVMNGIMNTTIVLIIRVGEVRPVIISLKGKKSRSANDYSSARYGAKTGTDLGPSSAPSESDKAGLAHPLIEEEAEEVSFYLDSSLGPSEDNVQSDKSKVEGSIASYDREIKAEKASIQVTKRDPQVCAANQRSEDWWNGFLQRVKACTCV